MRYLPLMLPVVVAACATTGNEGNRITVETTSKNQVIAGANCIASNNTASWNIVTPGTIDTGEANGDLRIVCSKAGYRTSEFIFRPSPQSSGSSLGLGLGGGGGHVGGRVGFAIPIGGNRGGTYPPKVTIDMSPVP
ncbi:MAG: hypothetical protein HYS18_15675 [Burkholderiales bacterium]|nr:hypothetical protein [Burkholderiales bacterium]